MFLDTAFLAHNIPRSYIPPVKAYRTAALEKVLPVFDNLEQEADEVAEAEFKRLGAMPASDDHYDLGDLAEQAELHGIEYGETMFAIRQSVLNVLAAGLYHLFEQQQKSLFYQTVAARTGTDYGWKALNSSLLASGVEWATLPGVERLEELRLAANTIKHGPGRDAPKLARLRPDLFLFAHGAAEEAETDRQQQDAAMWASDPLFSPLGGGDLYVSETDLVSWSDALLQFWRGLAAFFWKQHWPGAKFPPDP